MTVNIHKIEQAAETIQRDPEAAQATLQAHSRQEVTMADVMGLMQQMTQMVNATMGAMQVQIEELKQANRKPGEKSPWTEEDLARLNDQQKYLQDFWASEPQINFYVQPTPEEAKIRESVKAREYPKRPFQVNGVTFWLTVGKVAPIPQSIAERLEEQQDGFRPIHGEAPQGLDTIPRPPRTPLATEAGRPGNLGEGPLQISHLPAEPIGMR